MVIIGTGPGDPRAWVQAAYAITAALEDGGPRDPLPTQPEIARELGVSPGSAHRAYRELSAMGLVWLVPGLGYFPGPRSGLARREPGMGRPLAQDYGGSGART